MNFDFSPDQKQIQDEAHRFLSEQCGTLAARRILDSDEPHDERLWTQIAELGWTGICIPENYGGIGSTQLELCVIAEELGRFVAPVPFSSSIYLAAEALMAYGTPAQKEAWLPRIASGEIIATFAMPESFGDSLQPAIATGFENGKLSGCKIPVADGLMATLSIVVAMDRGEVRLFLVDLSSDDVKREPLESIDPSRGIAKIIFNSAKAEPLGDAHGWDSVRYVLSRAAVLFAFEQIGGADACLDMARTYATERLAFGRKIGSYQAIKHKLADMYVNNQIARSNSYYGAWALAANNESLQLAAALSRVSAIQAYYFAAKENLQTHGAMGFSWETDCHLFYRRAKHLALILCGERPWKEQMISLAKSEQGKTQ